jgi:xanthine dehydrogenase accessory factor
MRHDIRVLVKGAGDLATGVAARLWRSGMAVVMTELERPLTIRRTVAFSEAVYDGETTVEDLIARKVRDAAGVCDAWQSGIIPVLVDSSAAAVPAIQPDVVVDAILAKRNLGTRIGDAPLVIGLGPGFTAGEDVHAVIETNRGHYLGRVLWHGSAEPDTGVPGVIGGVGRERVIYAPADGEFRHRHPIGSVVAKGEVLGFAGDAPVLAPIAGVLRGLIHDGNAVRIGLKIGDVDPRGNPDHCFTISDKALAIGGGVLEAVLAHLSAANGQGKSRAGEM